MSKLASIKLLGDIVHIGAQIAKLGAETYGTFVDKSREKADREARIKELEKQLADLKAKAGA